MYWHAWVHLPAVGNLRLLAPGLLGTAVHHSERSALDYMLVDFCREEQHLFICMDSIAHSIHKRCTLHWAARAIT
jgi:hypothetical protein